MCGDNRRVRLRFFYSAAFSLFFVFSFSTDASERSAEKKTRDERAQRCLANLVGLAAIQASADQSNDQAIIEAVSSKFGPDSEERSLFESSLINGPILYSGLIYRAIAAELSNIGVKSSETLQQTIYGFHFLTPEQQLDFATRIVRRIGSLIPSEMSVENISNAVQFAKSLGIDLHLYKIWINYWNEMRASEFKFAELKYIIVRMLLKSPEATFQEVWNVHPKRMSFQSFFNRLLKGGLWLRGSAPEPRIQTVNAFEVFFENAQYVSDKDLDRLLKRGSSETLHAFIVRELKGFTPSQVERLLKSNRLSYPIRTRLESRRTQIQLLTQRQKALEALKNEISRTENELNSEKQTLEKINERIETRRKLEERQASGVPYAPEFPLSDAEFSVLMAGLKGDPTFGERTYGIDDYLSEVCAACRKYEKRHEDLESIVKRIYKPYGKRLTQAQFDTVWKWALRVDYQRSFQGPIVAPELLKIGISQSYGSNHSQLSRRYDLGRFHRDQLIRLNEIVREYGAIFEGNGDWFAKMQANFEEVLKRHGDAITGHQEILQQILKPVGASEFWQTSEPIGSLQKKHETLLISINALNAKIKSKSHQMQLEEENLHSDIAEAFTLNADDIP
ncbi:MAG: hypothetical protein JWQ35_262 [Bacteriovoracaceae bacterium]|nr:hypothetical protein [Bacteriovoracaceae bacterium]